MIDKQIFMTSFTYSSYCVFREGNSAFRESFFQKAQVVKMIDWWDGVM